MSRKRIVLVAAALLPILVLGACGKRSVLKRVHEPGVAVPAVMPAVRGTPTGKAPKRITVLPGVAQPEPSAAVVPGAMLPDPDPFGTRQ